MTTRRGTAPLVASGLSKAFGGIQANSNVSFQLGARDRLAIIGPNGAGKSTLLNLISGLYAIDAGELHLYGAPIHTRSALERVRLGIGRSFQRSSIFGRLTVLENVLAASADQAGRKWSFGRWRAGDLDAARELVRHVGLGDIEAMRAGNLSYGGQRALEIAVCLATQPRVLLLDEPTQGLAAHETREIVRLLAKIGEAQALPMIIIEHDMSVVGQLANRVLVLHMGEVLVDGMPEEVARDQRVKDVYLGKEGGNDFHSIGR